MQFQVALDLRRVDAYAPIDFTVVNPIDPFPNPRVTQSTTFQTTPSGERIMISDLSLSATGRPQMAASSSTPAAMLRMPTQVYLDAGNDTAMYPDTCTQGDTEI